MGRAARRMIGHNGGPPLETPRPWGNGSFTRYFEWKAAVEAAWKKLPAEIALRRLGKAEALGLPYEDYTLEGIERGRFLQDEDGNRITEIKADPRRQHAGSRQSPK